MWMVLGIEVSEPSACRDGSSAVATLINGHINVPRRPMPGT
jgi:hypothetical protein